MWSTEGFDDEELLSPATTRDGPAVQFESGAEDRCVRALECLAAYLGWIPITRCVA